MKESDNSLNEKKYQPLDSCETEFLNVKRFYNRKNQVWQSPRTTQTDTNTDRQAARQTGRQAAGRSADRQAKNTQKHTHVHTHTRTHACAQHMHTQQTHQTQTSTMPALPPNRRLFGGSSKLGGVCNPNMSFVLTSKRKIPAKPWHGGMGWKYHCKIFIIGNY